uniref:Uncharacterized protein n=1 Tax=Oryza glumipatula TaxID=40148 RepID=A0A0D9Y7D0_9ORYZ
MAKWSASTTTFAAIAIAVLLAAGHALPAMVAHCAAARGGAATTTATGAVRRLLVQVVVSPPTGDSYLGRVNTNPGPSPGPGHSGAARG